MVRKAAASLVVPDEHPGTRQAGQPVAPDRAVPVVVEMRQPVRSAHERRPISDRRVAEADTIVRCAEADPLFERRRSGGGWSGSRVRHLHIHLGHELVAAAVRRADHRLRGTVIAHRPSGLLDPSGQGRLADELVAPNRVEQFLFAHHPISMLDQVDEHVEHLRLHLQPLTPMVDGEPVTVNRDIAERITHGSIIADADQPSAPMNRSVGDYAELAAASIDAAVISTMRSMSASSMMIGGAKSRPSLTAGPEPPG